MATEDDFLNGNPNHKMKEEAQNTTFAEASLPRFKFLPEHRSAKPEVTRRTTKYIESLNTIQDSRNVTYSTVRDKNLTKESRERASNKMHNKLFAMVKTARAEYNDIVKLGGRAPSVPERFDTLVKVPNK